MARGANPGRSGSVQPMAASRFKGAPQGAEGKMTVLAGIADITIRIGEPVRGYPLMSNCPKYFHDEQFKTR